MFRSQYNSSSTVFNAQLCMKTEHKSPALHPLCSGICGWQSAVRKAHLQSVTKQMLWRRREEKRKEFLERTQTIIYPSRRMWLTCHFIALLINKIWGYSIARFLFFLNNFKRWFAAIQSCSHLLWDWNEAFEHQESIPEGMNDVFWFFDLLLYF